MITGIRRVVKAGFVGFWRNAYVSLSSVFVITVALFVIGATMMLDQLLVVSLKNLESKVDINVYFVTSAQEADVFVLKNSLEAMPDVASVNYVSKEEVLAQYRNRNQTDTVAMQALDALSENPFGATLIIQAKETTQYENIARFLEDQQLKETSQNPLIDRINYNRTKDAIDRLTSIMGAVERGSFITLMVLIGAAILITFNTIRLAIYTAREEIAVMRLVGASNAFIRGPFLLQGIMYGFVAGTLALLSIYPMLVWVGPKTAEFFEFNVYDYFIQDFAHIFLVIVGIGVVLGFVSSILAIARYLKV